MFKTNFILFIVCNALSVTAVSQFSDTCYRNNENYVFVTYGEFKNCSPSLKILASKEEKIGYYFPFGLKNLKVIKRDTFVPLAVQSFFSKRKDGKTIFKFKHGKIYGYYKNGEFFRYYAEPKNWKIEDDYYKIEEKGTLIIYSKYVYNGKAGSSLRYFYGFDFDGPIRKLNLKNLEADFKDNADLWDRIKTSNLLKKDLEAKNQNGSYLLNEVLEH